VKAAEIFSAVSKSIPAINIIACIVISVSMNSLFSNEKIGLSLVDIARVASILGIVN